MKRRSKMKLYDRIEHLLAVGNIIILLLYIPITYCQKVPPEDDDRFQFAINQLDLFRDNHVIPDGTSVSAYLYKDKPENFFFRVEQNYSPVKIILTPCSSSINWILKRRNLLPDFEDAEEESPVDPYSYRNERSVNRRRSSPYSIVGNYSGAGASTYYSRSVRSALYMLMVTALDSDTSVQFYGTTSPSTDHVMPVLPENKTIIATSVSNKMFTVQWINSRSEHEQNDSLEYCVSVNRLQNLKTHCSAVTKFHGSHPPKRSTGWGFSWERKSKQRPRQLATGKERRPRDRTYYECVGSRTKYTFKKAKPGKTYFVDVFVLNRKVNTESAYSGIKVKTTKHRKKKRKVALRDGVRRLVKLQKGLEEKNVTFKVNSKLASAILELKTCRGKVPITIYHYNANIHQTFVRSFKLLRMKHLPVGLYTIKLSGNPKRKRVLSLFWSTSNYKKPKLPKDTRVQVYNQETTCNSVTLAWYSTKIKQRYCLYKSESSVLPRKRSYHCREMSGRRKKDKIMCVRFKWKDRDKDLIVKTVNNLKPDTNYLFDVYVNRGKSSSLHYKSVLVRTKPSCD